MDGKKPEVLKADGLEQKSEVLRTLDVEAPKESLKPFPEEQKPLVREEQTSSAPPVAPVQAPSVSAPVPKDPLTQEIESVLEEDLDQVFGNLPPKDQARFKAEGERVAGVIKVFIEQTKFSLKKVLRLLTGWLRMIPGVNRFFLEQEAKIKTDKLLAIAEEERERHGH